jgi:hypothetical protein
MLTALIILIILIIIFVLQLLLIYFAKHRPWHGPFLLDCILLWAGLPREGLFARLP